MGLCHLDAVIALGCAPRRCTPGCMPFGEELAPGPIGVLTVPPIGGFAPSELTAGFEVVA